MVQRARRGGSSNDEAICYAKFNDQRRYCCMERVSVRSGVASPPPPSQAITDRPGSRRARRPVIRHRQASISPTVGRRTGRLGRREAGDTISTVQAPRPIAARAICSLSERSRSVGADWKTGRGVESTTSALRDSGCRAICNLESASMVESPRTSLLAAAAAVPARMQVATEPKRRSWGTKLRSKTSPGSAIRVQYTTESPIDRICYYTILAKCCFPHAAYSSFAVQQN